MAETDELSGGAPSACPFIALELDRDRRSQQPDYRHRCFAEPNPAPRAIAHQAAYCLSPGFAACPVFQDWALRAAARPLPGVPIQQTLDTAHGAAAAFATGAPEPISPPHLEPEPFVPGATDQPVPIESEPFMPAAPFAGWTAESEQPLFAASAGEVPDEAGWPDSDGLPSRDPLAELDEEPDAPPVPPFLAGRPSPPAARAMSDDLPSTPPSSSLGRPRPPEHARREEIVPSWEIDGRFGAEAGEPVPNDRFGGLLTTLAVVAILALGVAGVIFLPGLLPGGGPAPTASASIALPSAGPTPVPTGVIPTGSLVPTATPTQAVVTPTPTPVATPHLYRIRAGDTLAKIARREDVTVPDIIAANPQIVDPNHIEVGQWIVIPQPGSTPTSAP